MPKVHDEVVFEEWWKILTKCWFLMWVRVRLNQTFLSRRRLQKLILFHFLIWLKMKSQMKKKVLQNSARFTAIGSRRATTNELWKMVVAFFFSYLVLFRSKCLVVVLNNNKWFLLFFYFFSFCWRTWLMTKLAEVKLMEVSLRLLILWSKLSWPLLTMNIVLSYVPNQ